MIFQKLPKTFTKAAGLGTAMVLGVSGLMISPVAAEAASPNDVVGKYGQRSPSIKNMQQDLIKLGYMRQGLDTGYYGSITRDAVYRFQKNHKLRTSSTITRQLYVQIDNAAATMKTTTVKVPAKKPATKNPASADSVYVKFGETSTKVRYMQQDLIKLGYMKTGLDTGYYGPITRDAVYRFQKAHKQRVTSNVTKRVYSLIDENAGTMATKPAKKPVTTVVKVPQGVKIDKRCLNGARVLCADLSANKIHLLKNGKYVESFTVRHGKGRYATRKGEFRIYGKERNAWSSLYKVPMPFSLKYDRGIYIHYSQEFHNQAMNEGFAAAARNHSSHGCQNIGSYSDAQRLFNTMRVGDKVVVYGTA